MRLPTWIAALCTICLLVGCGGDGKESGDAQTRVKQWLPKAENVRCTSPRKDVTNCEASVPKRPVGTEHWRCSFEDIRGDAAYSGSHSCWTEDGSQDGLAKSVRVG